MSRAGDLASCSSIISRVLSLEVHKELAALIGTVNALTVAATERAPVTEIELRVTAARESASRLERATGCSFEKLRQHLYWLERRHREGSPSLSDGDVADLLRQDLPLAVEAVTTWATALIDKQLVAAITRTWQAQDYDGAVRDAFNELEKRMKARTSGTLFGRKLVDRILDPERNPPPVISEMGFMGPLEAAERRGAYELIRGSIGLFRNATAHRAVPYTREQASDVIHLVNICLRLVDKVQRS